MVELFIFVLIVLFALFFTRSARKNGVPWLVGPVGLATIFFTIVHLLMPLWQWSSGFFRYEPFYSGKAYFYSIFLVGLGHVLFCLVYIYGRAPAMLLRYEGMSRRQNFGLLGFSWVVFLVGLYFSYSGLSVVLAVGVERYLQDRISYGSGDGARLLFSHWTYTACILFFVSYLFARPKTWLRVGSFVSFFAAFSWLLVYYSIMSNRNSIFLAIVCLLAIWFVSDGRGGGRRTKGFRKVTGAAVVSVLAASLFFLIGLFRNQTSGAANAYSYGALRSANGAFGNHENVVWLISGQYELQWGGTYLAAITNFIPRSVWPDKPVGGGPILKNMVDPGSYVVGSSGNSSLTTGLYTEALLNFGIFGVVLIPFVLALVMLLIVRKFGRHRSPFVVLTCIYICIALSSQIMYAEFLGFLARTVFTVFPLIVAAMIFRRRHTSARALDDPVGASKKV